MKNKKLKNATTNDLFIYFLLISEYKNSLFIMDSNGDYFMPNWNESEWDEIPYMIKHDLKLCDHFGIGNERIYYESIWQWLREMWKVDCVETKYISAKIVSKWGNLQSGVV